MDKSNKNYEVDNILEEIKRKKSLKDSDFKKQISGEGTPNDAFPQTDNWVHLGAQTTPSQKIPEQGTPVAETAPPVQQPPQKRAPFKIDPKNFNIPDLPPDEPPVQDDIYMTPTSNNLPPPQLKRRRSGKIGSIGLNFGSNADISADNANADIPKEPTPKTFEENYEYVKNSRPTADGGATIEIDSTLQSTFPKDAAKVSNANTNIVENVGSTAPNLGIYSDPPEEAEDEGFSTQNAGKVIEDYSRPADATTVYRDIQSIKLSLFTRIFVLFAASAASTYLAAAQTNFFLPLPPFMVPEKFPQIYMIVNFVLLLFAALFCHTTVGGGLISLFKLRADSDSPVAISTIVALVQGMALTLSPTALELTAVHFYFPVVLWGLFFNTLGKLFMVFRMQNNFATLRKTKTKHGFLVTKNRELMRELLRSGNTETQACVYTSELGFATNFLEISYKEDFTEELSRITTPIFLIFCVLLAVVSYLLNKDIFVMFTALSAAACVCAPFTSSICANLPFLRVSNKMAARGAAVFGFTAFDDVGDSGAMMVDSAELFPDGSVVLGGIKVFDQKRIDEAILDAASVICSNKGILSDIFLEIIGRRENILKPVDSLIYEDSMGLSAWVGGKRVLIGNRALMQNHSIDTPSQEFEDKYHGGTTEVLYLANSGELTAMFVLGYNGESSVKDALEALKKSHTALCVHTVDPNITAEKLEQVYGYPAELVEIMPAKLHAEYDKRVNHRERARTEIIYSGDFYAKATAFASVFKARFAIVMGFILQSVGMVAGYGIVAFFAFTGSLSALDFITLLAFELIWASLIMILPSFTKY